MMVGPLGKTKEHSVVVVGVSPVTVASRNGLHDYEPLTFIESARPIVVGLHGQLDLLQSHVFCFSQHGLRQSASDATALRAGKHENAKGSRSGHLANEDERESRDRRLGPRHRRDEEGSDSEGAEDSQAEGPGGDSKQEATGNSSGRQGLRSEEPGVEVSSPSVPEPVVGRVDFSNVCRTDCCNANRLLPEPRHRNEQMKTLSLKDC